MKKYGGEGYDSLFRYGIPRLKQAGVTQEQIDVTRIEHPKRLLPRGV
jgi:predicted metal-dependent phosphotriesterase family hydrolase